MERTYTETHTARYCDFCKGRVSDAPGTGLWKCWGCGKSFCSRGKHYGDPPICGMHSDDIGICRQCGNLKDIRQKMDEADKEASDKIDKIYEELNAYKKRLIKPDWKVV